MKLDYQDILEFLRPGSERIVRGNCYEGIEWVDKSQTKPTKEECDAAILVFEKLAYREQRAKAYPSVGDQLDALWKGGASAKEMLRKILAVKSQFPKPE